jgi:hypothetical protein
MTAIPTNNGIGQEGNFLFDTGAQMSLISEHLAIAIGLDSNGDGVLDHRDDAYLGPRPSEGLAGRSPFPIFAIDEVRVPVTKVSTGETVELVWTDLQWLVLDIDLGEGQPVLDGVFGSDLLTSGWFHAFFYPGQPDGYIDQVHLDFRGWGLDSGARSPDRHRLFRPERSGRPHHHAGTGDSDPGDGPLHGGHQRRHDRHLHHRLQTVPTAPVEITVTAEGPCWSVPTAGDLPLEPRRDTHDTDAADDHGHGRG